MLNTAISAYLFTLQVLLVTRPALGSLKTEYIE